MKNTNLILALLLAVPARAVVVEVSPVRAIVAAPLAAASAVAGRVSMAPALSNLGAAISSHLPGRKSDATPLPASDAVHAPTVQTVEPGRLVASNEELSVEERLHSLFALLDQRYPLPADSLTAKVRGRVRDQLLSAAQEYEAPSPEILEVVARECDKALVRIQERLDAGEIDPTRRIRVSEDQPEILSEQHARVGVYPVAADPFQWGHLIIALRAVGSLGVDKVVFVLAGDDPRKPTMTPVEKRHPMGREVLALFEPFFEYSPIAVGTTLDGETNIFRILALNGDRRVDAWYMVGDDHYRLVDKKGNPDTLPKLEANYARDLGHNRSLHNVKVSFIRREQPDFHVPTDLEVAFLDHVGFEASSTLVRGGQHSLMPYAAYSYARNHLGMYGIPSLPPAEPKKKD